MRKYITLLILCLAVTGAYASSVDAMASYVYSSDYNQARAGLSVPIGLNAAIGLEGKYVEDKIEDSFKDPVYSVYLPVQLDINFAHIILTPFYYAKNKSHDPLFQDASAFGLTAQLHINLVQDEINEHYAQAFLEASFARQKGTVQEDKTDAWNNQYYDQAAFTLGLRQNFYNAFIFQISGTAYQYPDGISHVKNFRGVLDQKDLGFIQSYDVSRALGKYALAARVSRMWAEKHSSLYLGYHYAEFYTADPQHSILIGNTFRVASNAYVDMAYNHLQSTNNQDKNKRDLFFINLNIAF